MPAIRSISDIARKWTDVTPGRADEYKAGVEAPKKDWEAETKAAEGAYEEGVTAAISEKRFGRGVGEAGTAKWKKGATEKGVARFGPGVRLAGPAYASGFGPYRDVIERVSIPPRGPKGDPRNYDRVRAIGEALHAAKVGR